MSFALIYKQYQVKYPHYNKINHMFICGGQEASTEGWATSHGERSKHSTLEMGIVYHSIRFKGMVWNFDICIELNIKTNKLHSMAGG